MNTACSFVVQVFIDHVKLTISTWLSPSFKSVHAILLVLHGGRCLPSRRNGLRPEEAKNVCEFFGGRFSSLWGLAGLPGNCLAGRVFGEYKVHK